jgi:hypothetical protein
MSEILILDPDKFSQLVRNAVKEGLKEANEDKIPKVYTINQVARKLGKAHATVKKMVERGYLKTTKDGLIPETAIEEYLDQK